ncbi:MAG: DUF1874 domain-containing protein [Candidatus Lokiarchaeota archaeon]|nr:DUF1874 domain-containing protein [Candidatus Lokiarchaeota archaeon]
MMYIANAFSLQMQGEHSASSRKITLDDAKEAVIGAIRLDHGRIGYGLRAVSCVGHKDIAAVMSDLLGYTVPSKRISVALEPGDTVIVGQYVGPRLPEGCTLLPEGAKIEWYEVTCHKASMQDRREALYAEMSRACAKMEWPDDGPKAILECAEKHFPHFFDPEAWG